ncbi:hypothetical protein ABK040_001297 [Willaertia magna]
MKIFKPFPPSANRKVIFLLTALITVSIFFVYYFVSYKPPKETTHSESQQQDSSSFNNKNNIEPSSLTLSTEYQFPSKPLTNFFSHFQCNTYQHKPEVGHPIPEFYPRNTVFAHCKFRNLCMNRKGDWYLFLNPESTPTKSWTKSVNGTAWIYTQPRVHSSRGDFKIYVMDGPVQKTVKNGKNYIGHFELSDTFHYIEEPTIITQRYVGGNVGHLLMDGIIGNFQLLMSYNMEHVTNNRVLFLDDIFDEKTHPDNWVSHFNYDKNTAEKYSVNFYNYLTPNPVLQKCKLGDGHWTVTKAPCRNNFEKEPKQDDTSRLEVCFNTALGGMTRPFLLNVIGAEIANEPFRRFVSKLKNINFNVNVRTKKDIVVAIHRKPKESRHGEIIWNIDELLTHFRENLPKESFIRDSGKELKIIDLSLAKLTAEEQLKLFPTIDLYIVDQGSAAYYSVLLPNDAIVIQSPHCNHYETNDHCYDRFSQYILTFHHVRVFPILSLLSDPNSLKCNAREVQEKSNCDPILPVEETYEASVRLLKQRFQTVLLTKNKKQ